MRYLTFILLASAIYFSFPMLEAVAEKCTPMNIAGNWEITSLDENYQITSTWNIKSDGSIKCPRPCGYCGGEEKVKLNDEGYEWLDTVCRTYEGLPNAFILSDGGSKVTVFFDKGVMTGPCSVIGSGKRLIMGERSLTRQKKP